MVGGVWQTYHFDIRYRTPRQPPHLAFILSLTLETEHYNIAVLNTILPRPAAGAIQGAMTTGPTCMALGSIMSWKAFTSDPHGSFGSL